MMKPICYFLTLFATLWQVTFATDWGTRLNNEQQWLVQSMEIPSDLQPKAAEPTKVVETIEESDSLSTGQAAPKRSVDIFEGSFEEESSPEQYSPQKRRSR